MAAKAQDAGSELMKLANAPVIGAQRSPFLEENDDPAELMKLSAEPAPSPISRVTSGIEAAAKNVDRAFTQFSEGFFLQKPGQSKAAMKVGRAGKPFLEGEKRMWSLAFPGLSGAAPPSFDEMESVAAEDSEFAQVWGGLKTELMASEDRASVIKPEEYERNKMLVAYEQYREAQDRVSEMNRGLSFEEFSDRAKRVGVPAPTATSPGVTFGQDAPEAPMPHDELKQFVEADIPGFTRPPLTKEEISAAAYEFMRGGAEEDLNKLPWVLRKVIGGLAAGTRMAVEIVPIGKAARALGAVGKAAAPFLEGAGQSAMDQGLAISTGAQTEPFSVGDVAAQALLMKGGSVAGKALAKAVPSAPNAAAMTGMVGTTEAGNAALNYAKTGKAPFEGSEDVGKDILGAVIEGAVTIGTASKLGGGKSAELSAGELAKARKNRLVIDRETYIAARKTGMSIEDSVRKALPKVFAEKDRTLQANELKIQDQFLQRQVRVLELNRDFDEYLDKRAGKDAGDRKELTFDLRRALEAGEGGTSRLAKGDAFAEGVAKLKALGGNDGGLAAGRAQMDAGIIPEGRYEKPDGSELTITKAEFDRGFLGPEGTQGTPVSREAADAGAYGELTGGFKFHEKRGFYFPLVVLGPNAPVPVAPGERGPRKPQQTKAPLGSAQVRGHAMRRTTKTFEDAIAKHNLDITHTKAVDLFLDQFEAAKRMMSLEIGRESGHVLTADELPNADALEAAKLEIVERSNNIRELQRRFSKMSVAEKAQARDQILADNIAIKQLRKIVKSEFFKEAKSRDPKNPEWGVYEGYYIHPELHARILDAQGPRSSGQYIRDAIVNKLKFARVGGSVKQWLPDIVGNAIKWATNGVSSWRQLGKAGKVELRGGRQDRVDMMFDVLSRNAELGGPVDLNTQEMQRTAKIDAEIAKAEREGRTGDVMKLGVARKIETAGDRVMGAIEKRLGMLGKGVTAPGRLAQKLGRARVKSDRASSRAAFRELMEKGVDGSGPLSASEAFEIVKKVDDYGMLHKGIQEAAKWMHFIRFPAKVVQATMAQMEKRPSIFGHAIPTPLDTVIRRNPGSGPAKAALVTRGVMRLATSVAQVAWIPMTAQKTMMEELGISQKKLDEYIDETYGWMPPQARFLTKLMFVPTGKTRLGGIEGFDASSFMPQAQMLRFFWMNFSKDGGDWQTQLAQEVLSKNLLTAPIAQGMTGKRFTGTPAPEGAGPGDRWYPAMTMLAPAFMVDTLNEWFQQNNVPESERSAMRGVLKSVVGVPMTVLRNKSFVKTMLDDFNERGIVEKVIGEDTGSWFYRVKNPNTPSGMAAQQIIDYAEKAQPDLFSFQMKQARKLEQVKEAVGERR